MAVDLWKGGRSSPVMTNMVVVNSLSRNVGMYDNGIMYYERYRWSERERQ